MYLVFRACNSSIQLEALIIPPCDLLGFRNLRAYEAIDHHGTNSISAFMHRTQILNLLVLFMFALTNPAKPSFVHEMYDRPTAYSKAVTTSMHCEHWRKSRQLCLNTCTENHITIFSGGEGICLSHSTDIEASLWQHFCEKQQLTLTPTCCIYCHVSL